MPHYKILLVCLIFFCWGSNLFAQSSQYIPFPTDTGHVWHILVKPVGGRFRVKQTKTVDTINFNGRRYVVLSSGDWVRNDTARKRVYGVPAGTFHDTLLYDFSLGLSDRVTGWYTICNFAFQDGCGSIQGDTPDVTISGVDSVVVGGIKRKRLYLRGGSLDAGGALVIEGIGSSAGIFQKINLRSDTNTEMRCFDYNLVDPFAVPNCLSPLAVDAPKEKPTFFLSPNPIIKEDELIITYPNSGHHISIQIFDLQGKLVYNASLSSNVSSTIISTRLLPRGFLNCRFTDGTERYLSQKLLIF